MALMYAYGSAFHLRHLRRQRGMTAGAAAAAAVWPTDISCRGTELSHFYKIFLLAAFIYFAYLLVGTSPLATTFSFDS